MNSFFFIIENKPIYNSSFKRGFGNGYVCINDTSKYFHKHFYNIYDVSIHGGLTYSTILSFDFNLFSYISEIDINSIDKNKWWCLGFDTAHYGDDVEHCNKKWLLAQTIYLKEQIDYGGYLNYVSEQYYYNKYLRIRRKNKLKMINL